MFRAAAVARLLRPRGSIASRQGNVLLRIQPFISSRHRPIIWRALSSSNSSSNKGTKQEESKEEDNAEEMTQEIMLTPGEKVVAGTRLTMWAMAAAFASVCAYYIARELIPT